MGNEGCWSPSQDNPTYTPRKENDDKPPENVIGAESEACSMDTIAGIVSTPTLGAPVSLGGDALSPPIIRSTTPTSSTRTNAPITGITTGNSYEEITPEEGR